MPAIGCWSKHLGIQDRQIRLYKLRCDGEGPTGPKYMIPRCQEKRLGRKTVPVPQTDTGR